MSKTASHPVAGVSTNSVAHHHAAQSDRMLALLPDLDYVRKIPILEVARELGINHGLRGATWTTARCFRPENHKNGDRSPSLNFQMKKNKFMCFVCDKRLRSNVDLVMSVLGCKMPKAMKWFDQKYPGIPRARIKKCYLDFRASVDFRAGVDEFKSATDLVRHGLLRHIISGPAVRVAWVLDSLRDANDIAEVSYGLIMHLAGIGSKSTVSDALRRLEAMHLFKRHKSWSRKRAGRDTSQYELTFDDPELIAMLDPKNGGLSTAIGVPTNGGLSTDRCTDYLGIRAGG